MASAWTPDQEALGQLTSVLAAADSPSTEAQQQVVAQLEHFSKSVPALPAYLVYIFALDRSGQSESVRLRAGLSLKNNVTDRVAQFPPEVLSYVKETVWTAMEDPSPQIRNTASSVIDWLFRTLGPSNWTDAILRLMQLMDSHSLQAKEVGGQSGRVAGGWTWDTYMRCHRSIWCCESESDSECPSEGGTLPSTRVLTRLLSLSLVP